MAFSLRLVYPIVNKFTYFALMYTLQNIILLTVSKASQDVSFVIQV